MNNDVLYPKTIDKLIEKISYIKTNEQNIERINEINLWLEWFNEIDYKLDYKMDDNQYLKNYIDNDKYYLQVWKHSNNFDNLCFNLLCNKYDDFNSEYTIIIPN